MAINYNLPPGLMGELLREAKSKSIFETTRDDSLFSQTFGGRTVDTAQPFQSFGRAYRDSGLTPPVGAWAGPGDKLLAAINRAQNIGRQVFDCRLGPGGIYHPEEVRR